MPTSWYDCGGLFVQGAEQVHEAGEPHRQAGEAGEQPGRVQPDLEPRPHDEQESRLRERKCQEPKYPHLIANSFYKNE